MDDERGVCFVCGCTDSSPCTVATARGVRPCAWANLERTLCDHPDCMEEALACPLCGISIEAHTPLMEAACLLRERRGEPGAHWINAHIESIMRGYG
jgi:hypothetical protein